MDALISKIDSVETQCAHDALGFYSPDEKMIGFFDDLCQVFLASSSEKQNTVRNAVNGKVGIQNNLVAFAYQCGEKLKSTKELSWLQKGLSALNLAESGTDYRDMLMARAELYVTAEEINLDPQPEFARISNLGDFGNYAVVNARRREIKTSRQDE